MELLGSGNIPELFILSLWPLILKFPRSSVDYRSLKGYIRF